MERDQISLSPQTVVLCAKVEVLSQDMKSILGFAAKLSRGLTTARAMMRFQSHFSSRYFVENKLPSNGGLEAKNGS
jgi:hypothetical protein